MLPTEYGLIFTATILDGLVLLFVGYEVVIGEMRHRRAERAGMLPPARMITMRLGLFIVLVASALFAVVVIGRHELTSPRQASTEATPEWLSGMDTAERFVPASVIQAYNDLHPEGIPNSQREQLIDGILVARGVSRGARDGNNTSVSIAPEVWQELQIGNSGQGVFNTAISSVEPRRSYDSLEFRRAEPIEYSQVMSLQSHLLRETDRLEAALPQLQSQLTELTQQRDQANSRTAALQRKIDSMPPPPPPEPNPLHDKVIKYNIISAIRNSERNGDVKTKCDIILVHYEGPYSEAYAREAKELLDNDLGWNVDDRLATTTLERGLKFEAVQTQQPAMICGNILTQIFHGQIRNVFLKQDTLAEAPEPLRKCNGQCIMLTIGNEESQ